MTEPRVFLIHGWGGSPSGDWLGWAKAKLEGRGYEVAAPIMPDIDHPKIKPWVDKLAEVVGEPRSTDILVGHSIGTQTILRYLETQPAGVQFAKAILVAPWFTPTNLENDEAWATADPWFKTPMDFTKIKLKSKEFVTIFSDDDPWVPYEENLRLFTARLHPRVLTLPNHGHITADEGFTSLPELLPLFE